MVNGTALIDFKQQRQKRTKGEQDEQKENCQYLKCDMFLRVVPQSDRNRDSG